MSLQFTVSLFLIYLKFYSPVRLAKRKPLIWFSYTFS